MEYSSLEILSNELFEYIVEILDRQSICNLRLVIHQVAYKVTQRTFQSFFQKAHVQLERRSLEAFTRVTFGPLGSYIKELTIVGIVYDPLRLEAVCSRRTKEVPDPEHQNVDPQPTTRVACSDSEMAEAQRDLEHLRQRQAECTLLCHEGHHILRLREALQNMAGKHGRTLGTLNLEVIVMDGASKQELQPREARLKRHSSQRHSLEEQLLAMASTTFVASITALSTSGLSADSVNAFCVQPGSLRCSLPCDALEIFNEDSRNLMPFSNLKSLSIGISDKLEGDLGRTGLAGGEEQESRKSAEILDQADASGMSELLGSCLRLQHLHVSFYWVNGNYFDEEHDSVRGEQVHRLLQANLPSLQSIRLGGIEVQVADLSAFFKRHSTILRSIEMTLVLIYDGLLSDVLSLLASDSFQLDDIRLTDINDERTPLAYFEGAKEQQHTTISGVYYGRNMIHRWGPATREAITHSYPGFERREARRHADWRGHLADRFGRQRLVSPCMQFQPVPPRVVTGWINGQQVEPIECL